MLFLEIITVFVQIAVMLCTSDTEKRKIDATETLCENTTSSVIHIEAVGENDALHYLFTTWELPSGFVARTNKSVKVMIDCTHFQKVNFTGGSITLSEEPFFYHGFSFNKLYEYNDVDDEADLTKLSSTTEWNVTDFSAGGVTWQSEYNHTTHSITYTLCKNSTTLKMQENGSFSFSFRIHTEDGEADKLPHLQYNANITQMHLKLDRLIPSYPNSRFVLEMGFVSVDMAHSNVSDKLLTHKRLDDEHTPGVFQIIDWQSNENVPGSFLQWKPVCYTWNPHTITNSTQVHQYKVVNSSIPPAFRLAHGYLGENNSRVYMKATNVSFGLSKDKFYTKNNFTSWSLNLGYGSPPEETVSVLIILIISVGLGLPVLLIVGGSISMCVRKRKQQEGQFTSSYSRIQ